MCILWKLTRVTLTFSWVVRGLGYAIDRCTTRIGSVSRTARRTPNHQGSSLRQMRDQPSPWYEKVNKASPSIVVLRTVTAYRLEKFCVDYKIINTIHIHNHIIRITFIHLKFWAYNINKRTAVVKYFSFHCSETYIFIVNVTYHHHFL